jgi:vitamin B12 transporter
MKKSLIALLFILPFTARAQEKILQQEDATITATNSNQRNSETGRNIVIIKAALFEKLAVNSIDELLRYAAGIEVQQRGPQGSQSDILIRGGTFQQILILLDGVRLNDPLTGHFNGNIPIHPGEIDRIEILKGPASAVWGADAVGGVIHIITKAFHSNKITGGKKINLGFQLGQYGLNNFNFSINKKVKEGYYSIGVLSNNPWQHQQTIEKRLAIQCKNHCRF